MKRLLAISGIAAAGLLNLAGCAATSGPPVTILHGRTSSNLVHGGVPGELTLAETLAGRPIWPAIANGYELETYEESFTWRIDQPSFWERGGGGFQQSSQSHTYRAIRR